MKPATRHSMRAVFVLAALFTFPFPAFSQAVLMEDDFEGVAPGDEPDKTIWPQGNLNGKVRVLDNGTNPFGTPNQYLEFYDDDIDQSARMQTAASIPGVGGAITTLAMDFVEPAGGGSDDTMFGYAVAGGDLTAAGRSFPLAFDDGTIKFLNGVDEAGDNTYNLDEAYRLFVILNDTASPVVDYYDGQTLDPGEGDVWLVSPGTDPVFAGSGPMVPGRVPARVGFRSYTASLNQVWVDNYILQEGVAGPVAIERKNALSLAVSPPEAVLSWTATRGFRYTLQQTTDPTLAPEGWMDVPAFTNVPGVDAAVTVTTTLAGAATESFRLSMMQPPPFFADDLESGAPGWTHFINGGTTDWELGTPNYADFTSAFSGSNAWATGIDTYYVQYDKPLLRTPVIDLTGENAAVLSFMEIKDLEVVTLYGDYGYVDILGPSGAVLAPEIYAANGSNSVWTQKRVSLDPWTNQQIIIQFRMQEDEFQFDQQYGWGIDDIMVSAIAPPPPPPPPPPPFTNAVTSLVLVDSSGAANPPPDLVSITEGATLDLDALGVAYSNVNVRAEVDGAVGSVTFTLTGATTHNQTESVGPYYLFGDSNGDPADGELLNGAHTLVATPWSDAGGNGQAGTNLLVNFVIVSTNAP